MTTYICWVIVLSIILSIIVGLPIYSYFIGRKHGKDAEHNDLMRHLEPFYADGIVLRIYTAKTHKQACDIIALTRADAYQDGYSVGYMVRDKEVQR